MPLITVFTPAYNRAHTIGRTYQSLLNQNCKEFVWLIVDDGSTDHTADMVREWQKRDNGFEIRYIYKENGGMHTAHNVAYEHIDTELNVCIDSDDKLAPGAIEKIKNKWCEIKSQGYAGIIGLDAALGSGKIIGSGFPSGLKETTVIGYYTHGGCGDKKLVYRTDVIREYPEYPVFDGEKYVSLSYKYRLIDQDYKMAVLDEVLCEVEYQVDGSSMNMYRQYLNNPKGFAFWRTMCMKYPESKKRLFIDCIHYVSSSLIARNARFIQESPRKGLTICALPFGIILSKLIKWKAQKE